MSFVRTFGCETELGLSTYPDPSCLGLSEFVVLAYADQYLVAPWDDSPSLDPVDTWDLGHGVGTDLGGRLYVDHSHPEFSTPDVTSPRGIVIYEKVMEARLAAITDLASQRSGFTASTLRLHKNNTDGKAAYGYHINALGQRDLSIYDYGRGTVPLIAAWVPLVGSGSLTYDKAADGIVFRVSQRGRFFQKVYGVETTLLRPMFNTRDIPYAVSFLYRRIHNIASDSNMSELQTFLKVGALGLAYDLVETGMVPFDQVELADPLGALKIFDADPSCTALVPLRSGAYVTAVDILEAYWGGFGRYLARYGGPAWKYQVVQLGRIIIDKLRADPLSLRDTLDWAAKYHLMRLLREQRGWSYDHPKISAINLAYHDLDPERGLYFRLVKRGEMRQLLTEEELCVDEPPTDTRAYWRGLAVKYFSRNVGVSWNRIRWVDEFKNSSSFGMPYPYQPNATEAAALIGDARAFRDHIASRPRPSFPEPDHSPDHFDSPAAKAAGVMPWGDLAKSTS